MLEAARSQIAGTVPQTEVQNLPMNGRNFLDLALLIPGVSPTNIGSTQLFAETSAVPGQGISIGSQRNLSNSFIVDGLSANDDAAGLSGIPYGVDAVEQFQVVTSGGQAEFGRALGGYINVVTRSGTNTLHGTLYDFIRDDRFNAANALSGRSCRWISSSTAAASADRSSRNRTFYFSNFEQRLLDQSGLVTILPQNVPIINARLARSAIRARRSPRASIRIRCTAPTCSAKSIIRSADRISSASGTPVSRHVRQLARCRGLNAPTASAGLDNVDQSSPSATHGRSRRGPSTKRARSSRTATEGSSDRSDRTCGQHPGVASFGTCLGSPTRRLNRMYQVVNNLSHQAGAHALRAGVDFVFNDDTITYPRSIPGQLHVLVARELPDRQLQRLHPDVRRSGDLADQSEYRGLRAGRVEGRIAPDVESGPALRPAVPGDDQHRHQQPVAAVWDSHGRRRRRTTSWFAATPACSSTAFRCGRRQRDAVGRQHDRPRQSASAERVGIIPTQAGAPTFPNILPARLLTTTLVDFTTMDRNLQNAYSGRPASRWSGRSAAAAR